MPEPEEVYFSMRRCADMLLDHKTGKRWRTQRMRRWLQRQDACFKQGGEWVTTRPLLREAFPDFWHHIQSELPDE